MTFDAIAGYVNRSTVPIREIYRGISHYPLDPKKIRAGGSMHKYTT